MIQGWPLTQYPAPLLLCTRRMWPWLHYIDEGRVLLASGILFYHVPTNSMWRAPLVYYTSLITNSNGNWKVYLDHFRCDDKGIYYLSSSLSHRPVSCSQTWYVGPHTTQKKSSSLVTWEHRSFSSESMVRLAQPRVLSSNRASHCSPCCSLASRGLSLQTC